MELVEWNLANNYLCGLPLVTTRSLYTWRSRENRLHLDGRSLQATTIGQFSFWWESGFDDDC